MTDLCSLTLPELQDEMLSLGEKKFVASQIFRWLHCAHVTSFDEMTNLSKALRDSAPTFFRAIP